MKFVLTIILMLLPALMASAAAQLDRGDPVTFCAARVQAVMREGAEGQPRFVKSLALSCRDYALTRHAGTFITSSMDAITRNFRRLVVRPAATVFRSTTVVVWQARSPLLPMVT